MFRILIVLALVGASAAAGAEPVPILFDTDMDSDCDDLGALAMLHALADRGEARILATVASTRNEWSPACIAAVNAFYGRPKLPVGRPKAGTQKPSKYAKAIGEQFPHELGALRDVPDAMEVYRKALKAEKDGTVVIVTVGYLTNVAELIRLPATGAEPSGKELIEKKVKAWVCMGGNFVGNPPVDDLKLGNNNFTYDKAGAHAAVCEWPGKLVFVGREIGSVPSGLKVGARLKELPKDNPLRVGYGLYFGGEPKDRHVADQTTVLYAVRGLGDFWTESIGSMDLHKDMTFQWKHQAGARQSYLLKKPGTDRAVEKAIEELMMAPPKRAAK